MILQKIRLMQLSRRTKILVIVGVLVLVGGAYAGLRYWARSHSDKNGVGFASIDDLRNAKLREVPTKTLLFVFSIDSGSKTPFSLVSTTQYNSFPDKPESASKSYTFEIDKNDETEYATYFDIPLVNQESFKKDGTISPGGTTEGKIVTFRTERYNDGDTVIIRNNMGDILFKSVIRDVKVVNNSQDYLTVGGEDAAKTK